MSDLKKTLFTQLNADTRRRQKEATKDLAYRIDELSDHIQLNHDYLTPDDLPQLRLIEKWLSSVSDRVLDEIKNSEELKLI